ncbi:MAG: hypothetical protein ACXWB2_21830, partial [Acidimicrobiales bacterium]
MMMYYSHNLHFGAVSASMQGRCNAAKQMADQLAENLRPMAKEMPTPTSSSPSRPSSCGR